MTKNGAVTIFHNPRCSTSRGVLAMIRETGVEPYVVEYMQVGWTPDQLQELASAIGVAPAGLLRRKEALVQELGLAKASPEAVLDAMVAHPVLVERPIVVTPRGTVLCRPPERLWEVLERP
jgi:arsenate reductase